MVAKGICTEVVFKKGAPHLQKYPWCDRVEYHTLHTSIGPRLRFLQI